MSPASAAARRPSARTRPQVSSTGLRSWTATSAPASARATAYAAPRPPEAPVTRATRPSSENGPLTSPFPGSSPEPPPAYSGLHVDDAELAVDALAVGRHHPEEVDRATGRPDARVVAAGISTTSPSRTTTASSGARGVGVDELDAEGRRGHVDVEVRLLEHLRVLVGRPGHPVAGRGERDAGDDPPGLDVLPEEDVESPLRRRRAGREVQAGVLLDVLPGDELQGVGLLDRGRHLREVAAPGPGRPRPRSRGARRARRTGPWRTTSPPSSPRPRRAGR